MSGPYFEVKESGTQTLPSHTQNSILLMYLLHAGNIAVQLILGDAIARRALLAFMVSEHAEENVLFFEANLALASSRAFEADFKDIVDRFVRADTAMELNISQELKRRILQAQEECAEAADCSQLLHLAQKEVVQLMAGAFARFQQSKYFQEWREAEDAEFEAESLAADGKTEVLVVGDSLAVAKIISRALVTQGYAVDCAVDKDQALAKMSAKQVDSSLAYYTFTSLDNCFSMARCSSTWSS
jgi:CheY-like chemotaxis protein